MKRQCGADTATTFRRQPTPTLDGLLAKISAMALDLLPDNYPDVDPASLFLQITALREAEPAAARMAAQFDRALRDLLQQAGCTVVRQGNGSHEIWYSPITKRIRRPGRHSQPTHGERHPPAGWAAEGVFDTSRPHLILAADLVANTTPLALSLTAA
jgi:hypothetical protein